MARYTQAGRSLSITTPLGLDALLLESLRGTESISSLFSFDLELLAQSPVDFTKVLGKPASMTVSLPNGTGRTVTGIITQLEQGRKLRGPPPATSLLISGPRSRRTLSADRAVC